MNKTNLKKMLCLIACLVLVAAMALNFTGCGGNDAEASPQGESTSFQVIVTDLEGNESSFDISTDKSTVGEALLEKGLIAGEDSEYGLFVTTVNGITLDWDKDQKYWAFYIDGEYATTGVDSTDVTEGAVYSFVAEG